MTGEYTGEKTLSYAIVPKKTTIASIKGEKKGFSVKWKAVSKAGGYEIQYAKDDTFKNAKTMTVKKGTLTKATVSKLKASRKYYVRIRAYQKVKGKKYYSDWSKVKTVTTKK